LAATTQVEAVQLQRSSSAAGVGRIATDGRTPDTHTQTNTHTRTQNVRNVQVKKQEKKEKKKQWECENCVLFIFTRTKLKWVNSGKCVRFSLGPLSLPLFHSKWFRYSVRKI